MARCVAGERKCATPLALQNYHSENFTRFSFWAEGKMGKKKPAPLSLERNIYFYRIDAGDDQHGKPIPFDVLGTLQAIESLESVPFTDAGRYMLVEDQLRLCCWVDEISSTGKLRFGTIRRNGFPQQDRDGALSDLGLPQKAGLCESVHVKFFSDSIIGSDFNFYGPRISRLASYLAEKAPHVSGNVRFEPLLRRDISEQLARMKDVRLFQLKIRSSFAEKVESVNESLGKTFREARKISEADEIEITLSPKRFSRKSIGGQLLDAAKGLIGLEGFHEASQRCHVRGLDTETNRVELVDLLSDKLIVKKQIVRQGDRSRALDVDSAYGAIESAYEEVKDDLVTARGIQV